MSNLYMALTYLRHESGYRILWVDGICINQADPIERSQQVSGMKRVYARATTVLCCIGEERENTPRRIQ
jgi:hypothetical protein